MHLFSRRQGQGGLAEVHEERESAMRQVSHSQGQGWLSEVRGRGGEGFLANTSSKEGANTGTDKGANASTHRGANTSTDA
jgi:hypothetical protein